MLTLKQKISIKDGDTMGSVVSAFAYLEPMVAVVLNDLKSDSTVIKFKYYLQPGYRYRISYYDVRVKDMIIINGIFVKGTTDSFGPDQGNITTLVMDVSTDTHSARTNIRVADIKSIEVIENF